MKFKTLEEWNEWVEEEISNACSEAKDIQDYYTESDERQINSHFKRKRLIENFEVLNFLGHLINVCDEGTSQEIKEVISKEIKTLQK